MGATLLKAEEIKALMAGEWEALCPDMKLIKNDGTVEYEGSGVIRQRREGGFQIQLILSCSKNPGIIEQALSKIKQGGEQKAGRIIPNSRYFRLESREWCVDRIASHDTHTDFVTKKVISTIFVRSIYKKTNDSFFLEHIVNKGKNDSEKKPRTFMTSEIHFHLVDNFRYPANETMEKYRIIAGEKHPVSSSCSVAQFKSNLYASKLLKEKGSIVFTVKSIRKRSKHYDKIVTRSLEALEYVLGCPLFWFVRTEYHGDTTTTYLKNPLGAQSYRQVPPREINHPKQPSLFWEKLYIQYLDYILKDKKQHVHPLCERLRNCHILRKYDYSSHVLMATTMIEWLCKEYFEEEYAIEQGMIDAVKETLVCVRKLSIDKKFRDPIKTRLGELKKTRQESIGSMLNRLSACGIIKKRDTKAWKRLRNKLAHGERFDITQRTITDANKVWNLLNHIVFSLTNYKGSYTDYGQIGYPEKTYPSKGSVTEGKKRPADN